jgi:GT2 family glycosyltransferase
MISVIIPSHNRRILLQQVLGSLAEQTFPADQFEVIVVLDGCTDDSIDMLRKLSVPFCLHSIEQEPTGASAARNHGAKQAAGELLIFLDDDIVPAPNFIQAHVNAHQESNGLVVIGYSPAILGEHSFFSLELRGWWEAMFRSMRQPGHRFLFSDMLSGNFSISRDVFHTSGGFDLNFPVHEDYEFGVRLIRAGIAFAFEQNAIGVHHEKTDIRRPLQRKYHEGIADVQLGRMYPELIPHLLITRLVKHSLLPSRVLRFLQFKSPKIAEWVAALAFKALPIFEKASTLWMWRRTLHGLLGYWYWKGVNQELTTLKEVNDFVFSNSHNTFDQNDSEIDLDLSQGVDHAEEILERTCPNAARIYYEKTLLGCMPSKAGAERLRAVHLRPFLVNQLMRYVYDETGSQKVSRLPVSIEQIIAYSNTNVSPTESRE